MVHHSPRRGSPPTAPYCPLGFFFEGAVIMRVPIPTAVPLRPTLPRAGHGSRTSAQKRNAVLRAVADGESTSKAAAAAGVPARTVQDWIHRAKQHELDGKSTWELRFLHAHEAAEGRFLAGCVKDLVAYAEGDWRAMAWILERRDPETWGRPVKVEHTGVDGESLAVGTGPVVVNLIVKRSEGDEEETPFSFVDRSEAIQDP